jgi:hypothetical protein
VRNLLILKGTFCDKSHEYPKSVQQYQNKEVEVKERQQAGETAGCR